MKNTFNFIGFIVLAAVIGLTMTACDTGSGGSKGPQPLIYQSTSDVEYVLIITGDTYELTRGSDKSTGTVVSKVDTTYILKPSITAETFTATVTSKDLRELAGYIIWNYGSTPERLPGQLTSTGTGDKTVGGKGVLGQVSGVVYNSVTAQPIDGVTVEMGTYKTTTDKNGNYLFRDVGPGEYTISYVKDGFQFRTKEVTVDPTAYKTDDPFAEYQALREQFEALDAWAATQKVIPDYAAIGSATSIGGNTINWTYNGGLTVDGNNASITINNDLGQFEIKNGLNFAYSKAYPIYITSLAPLTGAIKVQVKLFNTPYNETFKNNGATPVPVAEGTEFWFTSSNVTIGQIGTSLETVNTVRYGPGKANKNGEFLITGLPAGVSLTFLTNGFVQKINNVDYYFSAKTANTSIYAYNNGSNLVAVSTLGNPTGSFFTAQNSVDNRVQNYTNAGTVYLFPEGTYLNIFFESNSLRTVNFSGKISKKF